MNILIVAAGEKPSDKLIKKYAKTADYIIAADGGTEVLMQNNITPDLFVGDCDSVSDKHFSKLENTDKIILPAQKDKTDLEEALDCAIKRGAAHVSILGALGKRLDHTLGNLQILLSAMNKNVFAEICDELTTAFVINSKLEYSCKIGTVISLIPFFGEAKLVNSFGLEYSFETLELTSGSTVGISNVTTEKAFGFEVKSGNVLVVVNIK